MHHVVLERWSRGASWLHQRDARAKTAAALAFLILLGTARHAVAALSLGYLAVLCGALLSARVPLAGALARAAVVLPFTGVFALLSAAAGEPERAMELLAKSYLSALAVVALVSTTPMPELLRGLESLGAPRFLLLVAQFLYRYLFVISEEAQHMRAAVCAKAGSLRKVAFDAGRFRHAAGALSTLFARSFARADRIHRAMLARGFQGHYPPVWAGRFGRWDAGFLALAAVLFAGLRLGAEWWR